MDKKDRIVLEIFIENPIFTIQQISDETKISRSSVQRILNRYVDIEIPSTKRTIKEQLLFNKNVGKQKGGRTTFKRYGLVRDKEGKFIGIKKESTIIDKEQIKRDDIDLIVKNFSSNPRCTIEKLTEEINLVYNKKYTVSYVYRCLIDPRVEEIFGELISDSIKTQLDNNRYCFFLKFKNLKIDVETLTQLGLDDECIAVLICRFNDGNILSHDVVAQKFNCSKTKIANIENRALDIIEEKLNEDTQDRKIKKLL